MATQNWQHRDRLFEHAVQLASDERARFLATECADQPELLAEIESLLAHHTLAPEAFLRTHEGVQYSPHSVATDRSDWLIGKHVGRFLVKELIGSGGMGVVYAAVQESPDRKVALKVLRPGAATGIALQRFQLEPELLGRLQHPHIAHVYESGTFEAAAGPMPYFAMEYISGSKDLVTYANEADLNVRDRLELLTKTCDAVHHGHQKGVIHRDLKPSNILVDRYGEPKVIDFGIARVTDVDLAATIQQTLTGQLVGTLQYMSPEQCDADTNRIDVRTDVYSLGVVAYELLTGQLPYDASGSSVYAASKAIKESAPARLSNVRPKLRRDVETIVLKALEKDQERRYQSAAGLARDIRHYINREPIEARSPTNWIRFCRWATRHPIAITSVACFLIAAGTVAATMVAIWLTMLQPHSIDAFDDRSEVRLLSWSGKPLKSWKTDKPAKIVTSHLVSRPSDSGDRSVVLLGYDSRWSNPFPGKLCAFFEEKGWQKPEWIRGVKTDEIQSYLRDTRSYKGSQFSCKVLAVDDIFDETPGPEIIVTHQHSPKSQCALRIYSLDDGEILYQAWQDGGLGHAYWMSDAKLLVLSGIDNTVPWAARGFPKLTRSAFVIFAVRPRFGFISDDVLTSSSDPDITGLEWWRCVLPPSISDPVFETTLRQPHPEFDPGRSVLYTLWLDKNHEVGVSLDIDDAGLEVSRTVSDAYEIDQQEKEPKWPNPHNPSALGLGDMPPIIHSAPDDPPWASPASRIP